MGAVHHAIDVRVVVEIAYRLPGPTLVGDSECHIQFDVVAAEDPRGGLDTLAIRLSVDKAAVLSKLLTAAVEAARLGER